VVQVGRTGIELALLDFLSCNDDFHVGYTRNYGARPRSVVHVSSHDSRDLGLFPTQEINIWLFNQWIGWKQNSTSITMNGTDTLLMFQVPKS
jgi:hypothetical protein